MALYWHPYLAELLRQDYGDRLIIEEEVALGDMPLRADLLWIRWDPTVALPLPFSFLGERTLVEYKSPDDDAAQEDLVRLEIYGLLYAQREALGARRDLTLWLPAWRFRVTVSRREGGYLRDAQDLGDGVTQGSVDGFPTFFIHLTQLPIRPEALPLLMVTRGPRERELVEFIVDHFLEYAQYVQFLQELHVQRLQEV